MFFQMKDTLCECTIEDIKNGAHPYIAFMSMEEFSKNKGLLDMNPDIDIRTDIPYVTCIQVNYDSLTGCFSIPETVNTFNENKSPFSDYSFSFAIDDNGIIFINDCGFAESVVNNIKASKKWTEPTIERLIYDFLEGVLSGDLLVLQKYEREMDKMEESILAGERDGIIERLAKIRSELLDLDTYYEQLIDLGQELCENENEFFEVSRLRYFNLFIDRVDRLLTLVTSLREHSMQVRDLYHSQLEVEQNKNMAYLTVVTTVFLPLTLITGWFGMNFRFMPELDFKWAYPAVFVVCIIIVIVCLLIFKKKKWI